jgi:hypothetical protein
MLQAARGREESAAVAQAAALMPLLRELGHLKRITSAGRSGSIATRLFKQAWGALVAGAEPSDVMRATVAAALAAARLGDLDAAKLRELGLTEIQTVEVLGRGFDAVTDAVDLRLVDDLREALGADPPDGALPGFVQLLADQPRAGVTCPGKPRLMLQPAENHAEHSITVALYGVLLSPLYGADPTKAFLAGLGHHFHNAAMPDSGFTGEVMLGDLLNGVIERARSTAMEELALPLRAMFAEALAPIGSADSAEGRCFNAADVIDRVLEIEQHLVTREASMQNVLHDYHLVHAGPVKEFHDRTLADVGLL